MNSAELGKWGALAPIGLPETVQFCRLCVLSNQKPVTSLESKHVKNDHKKTIHFDDGVCDACRWAIIKENDINWELRARELEQLCDKHRSSDGSYDVIVPASGGKDSRYVAHLLKENYGMHPLTVTWKPHKFTPIGYDNLASLIDLGFDNILISPNGKIQRRLTQLAFRNLGHPFQPFIIGQRVVGPRLALEKNIKLVFYGENVAEYGNDISGNYSPLMDPSLFTSFNFHQKNLDEVYIAGESLTQLIKNHGITLSDLEIYKSPGKMEVNERNLEVHYMSYYKKWVPQDNYYYAVEKTGFKPAEKRKDGSFSRYAGIDDMLEDLHFFMQAVKFGMGRCTWDAAQEVRTGKLEREEAVSLVNRYDQEPPSEYLPEILDYLELSNKEFWSIVNAFRPQHLWRIGPGGNFELNHKLR